MTDTKPQKPAPEKKAPAEKTKKPGGGFKIPQWTETQWGMALGGAFLFGYILYNFVWLQPVEQAPQTIQVGAPKPVETEEARFKRENKNVKLPDGSSLKPQEIAERTKVTQQIPFGDRELEFRVRLPSNWVMSEFARYGLPGEETYSVLTNIARYFGPAIEDARPFLWVEAERMKRFMTAETWARAYMIKRGISPEAMQINSESDIQALYVDVRDYRSYAMRTRFVINGDTMVMISFGVPIESYKPAKDVMGLTLNSFEFMRKIDRQIEEVKDYKLLNVIKFRHYASWLPKNEFSESTLRPSVELHNPQEYNNPKGDLLQGLILINAWRKSKQEGSDGNKELQEVKDRLQELRMTITNPDAPTEDLPLHGNFVSVKRTQYTALVNTYIRKNEFDIVKDDLAKTKQEIWITVLDNDYYVVYLTLITPLLSNNYVIWAQNMAAYDLLTKTLDVRGAPTD